uniref:Uncharacterized protein n=1 Tax=Siphoviridae sp. ctvok7 TaxID=2827596 RepID=A0A8S5LLZ9_9CAUD|nr:MAG TPA: hypothetical protein [Siphoviridae sp. ctvok7]
MKIWNGVTEAIMLFTEPAQRRREEITSGR